MAKQKYDEASALKSLSKKNSLNINRVQKSLTVTSNQGDLGNGSCGKIDYLVKEHGYRVSNPMGTKFL